jgi:hypothetical protein
LSAKELGWEITRGKLKPRGHCACSKAKQKNVSKEATTEKSKRPCERVYLDLSKITVPHSDGTESSISKKNWRIMVDEATGKKWSSFHNSKAGMVEPTCELLNVLKSKGLPVTKIHLDPAGENAKLEKQAKSADWVILQPIDFEFTSRDTPQHNCLAELAFPNLAGKARAMMSAAHCSDDAKGKIALECIRTATMLDGLKVVQLRDVIATRDAHVNGSNPAWARNLRTFGEAGVVKDAKNAKTDNRGTVMMFIGYPDNREHDSVRMWNPEMNGIWTTRDVIWLKRYYFDRTRNNDIVLFEHHGEAEEEVIGTESQDVIEDAEEAEIQFES